MGSVGNLPLTMEGYSILSGFGYNEVLHHLPLERERLHWKTAEEITLNTCIHAMIFDLVNLLCKVLLVCELFL